MIDPKLLRTDPEAVARNLARRGFALDVAALQALEDRRKPWQVELDRLRAERNANAKAVGMAKGRGEDTAALIAKGESLTPGWNGPSTALSEVQQALEQWQLGTAEPAARLGPGWARRERQRRGAPLGRAARAWHFRRAITWRSASALGGLDFEAAARISGAASW